MPSLDRLSSLVRHVQLNVHEPDESHPTNLWVLGDGGKPLKLCFCADVNRSDHVFPELPVLARAHLDLGRDSSPLVSALSDLVTVDLSEEFALYDLAMLFVRETENPRCGAASVFERLCELLFIHLLRNAIEHENKKVGLLAGLAHPQLSSVIVAMHDQPHRQWRIDDFTLMAGLSRTRFMEEFQKVMEDTPIDYLRRWRMTLARKALLDGRRVNEVARRYGYRSGEAFSRAFARVFGYPPKEVS